MRKLGLVAGGGGLPAEIAERCRRTGRPYFVVRLKGFADEGTFQERLDDVSETYPDVPEIMEIDAFIRDDATRPLCLPEREV